MWYAKSPEVLKTLEILEIWAKSKLDRSEWQNTLDLDFQEDLIKFAQYQSYINKVFKIVLPLKTEDKKRVLDKAGTTRLATRWLTWSNTCLKNEFLP